MIQFPLPYRIGEDHRPGNADEKVRCEVATYAWLQDNCPSVPIPRLYGFGLSTGKTFTILDNLPFLARTAQRVRRRLLSWLGYPIPVDMPQNITHTTVDSYVNDILAFHESRLRHQPNGIVSLEDGLYQTSALMVMRSILPCFFRRDLLRGPFFLNLTDLNQTNIFVDDNWNIECIIDLEWACSHPVEMIHPPFWLTNQDIDSINMDEYGNIHKEFMDAFLEEETKVEPPFRLYPILHQGWERNVLVFISAQ
ncbi:hypothetical protein N7535_006432 [Penicillium sp. DV-2018c]|nr:hypothetical protein N7461_007490 [Penicillium sp. DV-2018c]KAJ5567126.1 hypothetical protein N7535_006432 [Penicillium sp. DV-2018c]